MYKKYLLLAPDGEAAGGGESQITETVAQPPEGGGEEAAPVEAKSETPQLTAATIAAAMKEAGLGQTPSAPAQPERQYTREDYDRVFHVPKWTKQHVQLLRQAIAEEGGEEAALQLFNELSTASVKNAVTMGSYHLMDQVEKLRAEFAPLRAAMEEIQYAKIRDEFYSVNADLKGFEPLVDSLGERLRAQGFKGTKEEAFERVASEARKVLEKLDPSKVQQQKQTTTSRMSALSGGGQGGVGGGGGRQKVDPSLSVFD